MLERGFVDKRRNEMYSMTVEDAEDIRVEMANLRGQLENLADDRADLKVKGAERGKYTHMMITKSKRVGEMNIRLKDAPPAPLDPARLVDEIQRWIDGHQRAYEQCTIEFKEHLAKGGSWAYELGWRADAIVKSEWRTKHSAKIYDVVIGKVDEATDLEFVDVWMYVVEEYYWDLVETHMRAYEPQMSSTSMMHNFIALQEHLARARFIEELERQMIFWMHMYQGVRSWAELQ